MLKMNIEMRRILPRFPTTPRSPTIKYLLDY